MIFTYSINSPTTVTLQWPYWEPISSEPELDQDQRFNKKFWAQWFREFLFALRPANMEELKVPKPPSLSIEVRCRSGPIVREWKLKTWKQRFV